MKQFFLAHPEIALYLIVLCIVLMIVNLVRSVRRTERIRKDWMRTMKVGDSAKIPIGNGRQINGTITEINDDTYVFSTKIDKRWVYPSDEYYKITRDIENWGKRFRLWRRR